MAVDAIRFGAAQGIRSKRLILSFFFRVLNFVEFEITLKSMGFHGILNGCQILI